MRFLLDTNVFREIGRATPHANVAAWLANADDGDLAISVLTVREVRKGIIKLRATKPNVADDIDRWMTQNLGLFGDRILPVTREIADVWGEMLGRSEKNIDDTGLVATARVHGLVLVTRNTRHVAGRGAATLDPFKTSPRISRP
jgi:predicted nucleic acid-binding protein